MANKEGNDQSLGTVSYKVMELGPWFVTGKNSPVSKGQEDSRPGRSVGTEMGRHMLSGPVPTTLGSTRQTGKCAEITCVSKRDLLAGVKRTASSPAPWSCDKTPEDSDLMERRVRRGQSAVIWTMVRERSMAGA